ncbi:hypothetical protein, partial [Paramuribaculum intestinale]|uniref:hypothetical protein n=1 Tax=Paramuribaculum intestinale TaxID=2094151 RepID=UPI00272D0D42
RKATAKATADIHLKRVVRAWKTFSRRDSSSIVILYLDHTFIFKKCHDGAKKYAPIRCEINEKDADFKICCQSK